MTKIDVLEHITYIPVEEAMEPRMGFEYAMTDRWWVVDPEKGFLIYKGFAPQCNHQEIVVRRLIDMYPGCVARHYPVVFMRMPSYDR